MAGRVGYGPDVDDQGGSSVGGPASKAQSGNNDHTGHETSTNQKAKAGQSGEMEFRKEAAREIRVAVEK